MTSTRTRKIEIGRGESTVNSEETTGGQSEVKKVPVWPQPKSVKFNVMVPWITEEDVSAVAQTVSTGWVGNLSASVRDFEGGLSEYLGVPVRTVSNGSVALSLALAALDVGRGHSVLVPSFAYAAVASAVVRAGATPVFCDVDYDTWQISARDIAAKIDESTRALIMPHSYGVCGEIEAIQGLCRSKGIHLIEDVAEAFSGKFGEKKLGSFGDVATFSFFPNKLITTGEGGAVAATNQDLIERIELLRGQGMSSSHRYWFLEPGFNFRMSGMQAALGYSQLKRIDQIREAREEVEERYDALLNDLLVRPRALLECNRAPWLYSATLKVVNSVEILLSIAKDLADHGYETRPLFYPLESMPAFNRHSNADVSPESLRISRIGLSLPSSHLVKSSDQVRIASIIRKRVEKDV